MLEEPPLLQIRRHFRRPTTDVLARFQDAATGFLADCMDGRGALDWRIKPVDPACAAFAGAVLPCLCGPGDNLALLAALTVAQPGDVIMVAGESFEGLALCGDRVAGMARNRGVVAIVLDGMARDTPGIRAVGLPLFCRGVTPNSCNASGPGTVGEPLVVGGVAARAGDIAVGDCDGVVVVPYEKIDAVLDKLDRVRVAEAEMDAKVADGLGIPTVIEQLASAGRVSYLD
jgi:4-hydroxy-4-methyl-2-oxoglutarate aldolase